MSNTAKFGEFRFGEIIFLHETNTARLYAPKVDPTKGPAKVLAISMLLNGWRRDDQNALISGELIEYGKDLREGAEFEVTVQEAVAVQGADGPTEEIVTRKKMLTFRTWDSLAEFALERRKAELQRLENLHARNIADPDAAAELKVFKLLYCEDDGTLIKPRLWATTGHQRSIVYPFAMAMRLTEKGMNFISKAEKEAGIAVPSTFTAGEAIVPVMIKVFANEDERAEFQVRENEGKDDGVTPPDPLDRLASARMMLNTGKSQADIRRLFTATEGVKLYHLVVLDARFPRLDIWDRLHQDPKEHPLTALVYSKIKSPELPPITRRSHRESLDAHNQNERNKAARAGATYAEEEFLDEAGVEEFFRGTQQAKVSETGRAVKIMDKTKIAELKNATKDYGVSKALDAVLNNQPEVLRAISKTVETRNAVQDMHDTRPEVYSYLEELVTEIKRNPADSVVKAAIIAAIKVLKGQNGHAPQPTMPEASNKAPEVANPAAQAAEKAANGAKEKAIAEATAEKPESKAKGKKGAKS